jgi:hypothetical protein
MELKSRSFTSKEPHVAREPQVADPWSSQMNRWIMLYESAPRCENYETTVRSARSALQVGRNFLSFPWH